MARLSFRLTTPRTTEWQKLPLPINVRAAAVGPEAA
jgi:hypothetical protein